jgi:hypothetical protein
MTERVRILLGQLAAMGDCLYATAIARQIKTDFPGCHLTWAVSSWCRQVIEENPYVDDVWEIPLRSVRDIHDAWPVFAREARARRRRGEFDEIFLTQIPPANYSRFDGTIRASIFRGYNRPITVPVTPVMCLRDDEVGEVRRFVAASGLAEKRHRVLFECASTSGQSFVTPSFATEVARRCLSAEPDCAFVLSSNIPVTSDDPRIIDGSVLRFRHNAELTRYCTLLIGCSSGITWLATSDWARPLPMIQLLRRETSVFASVAHDADHFGLPTENILEMTDTAVAHTVECVLTVFRSGFPVARARFHETLELRLDFYVTVFLRSLIKNRHFIAFFGSVRCVIQRYGFSPFVRFAVDLLHGRVHRVPSVPGASNG